jgi:antitoxin MazE
MKGVTSKSSTLLCASFTPRLIRWYQPSASCLFFGLSLSSCARIYLVDTGDKRMKTTVKKWGNSAAVRIPATVMEAADIQVEDVVDVSEEEGRIIVKRVQSRNYDLDDLINGITSQNLHEPMDFGPPQGKEAW